MHYPNIKHYFISASMICFFSSFAHADITTLKKFENQIIQKYKDKPYYEINGDTEAEISAEIAKDPASLHYDFPKLQQEGFLFISYSPDHKLKFYSFDVSGGGTMGEWSNYVQYQINQQIKLDEFKAARIDQITEHKIKNDTIYLVENYDKGDNCIGNYQLRAVQMGKNQLLKSYIFKSKNQKLDEISVYYDCSKVKDYDTQAEYLRIKANTVDIMLTDKNDVPQNKYLRYSLIGNEYTYTGIVK